MVTTFDRIAFKVQEMKDGLQDIIDDVAEINIEGCRLQEESERLRKALEEIANYWNGGAESAVDAIETAEYIANQALERRGR